MQDINELRRQINDIDSELAPLLARRLGIAADIAAYKRENALPVLDRSREDIVRARARAAVPPEFGDAVGGSYDAIMAMSCLYQYTAVEAENPAANELFARASVPCDCKVKGKIGVQGCMGSYASIAAARLFGDGVLCFYPEWSDLLAATAAGEVDYSVLPIENSTAGSVNEVYRLLGEYSLYINAAYTMKIDHCLLVPRGCTGAEVTQVYSHPQALEQCRAYLARTGAATVSVANTATAAATVAALPSGAAAIAPRECAELYGLDIKDEHLQSSDANATRFIALGREPACAVPAVQCGEERISLRFSLEHSGGSLARVLSYFSASGLNLTKVESRRIPEHPDEYDFYLDFAGDIGETRVVRLITALMAVLPRFKFLGSYKEI